MTEAQRMRMIGERAKGTEMSLEIDAGIWANQAV
jgi:hypothetical protein